MFSAERLRLDMADAGGVPWRHWGPYLSERQWGTVREDHGGGGDTWSYFSFHGDYGADIGASHQTGWTETAGLLPPVFFSRRPDEPPDIELADWYRRLLAAVAGHQVRAGARRLLRASGWPDNQSCRNLAAWAGDGDGDRHLVVVNLSGQQTQARIPLDWPDLPGRSWQLTDILGPSVFKRDGGELASPGLFVDLGPWQFHLLALQ
jgi:hypothetical protein